MRTRKHGHANVEEHPKGSEQFRVRARIGKRLVTVVSRVDEKTAIATADTYGRMRREGELREGITLAQFGEGFLERRERRTRSGTKDRNRWKTHVDADAIGMIALRSLRRSDVVEWRDRLENKGLAAQTRRNTLNLLRVGLAEALDRELVSENVARDVRIGRSEATSHEDLEGILTPAEQVKLIQAVPEAHQPMVEVALFTGLRWAELSWLRREDIDGEEIIVRRSTAGGPTKSGKTRRVPMPPPARGALAAQLATVKRSCPWVFPSEDGKPRQNRPNAWPEWVKAAELGRHIRWHDLRHTCATSLLAGWWGEKFTLQEVCTMLGHSEISTTERYARKLDETLRDAVKKKFPGGNGNGGTSRLDSGALAFLNRRSAIRIGPGAQSKNGRLRGSSPVELGTFRELPRSLKTALKRTSARSTEGVLVRRLAAAYEGVRAGDEPRTIRELSRAAKGGGS